MVIEGRALFIGKPTPAVEAPSFSIKGPTPGLEERTLPLERPALRIERSSLRPIPPGDALTSYLLNFEVTPAFF